MTLPKSYEGIVDVNVPALTRLVPVKIIVRGLPEELFKILIVSLKLPAATGLNRTAPLRVSPKNTVSGKNGLDGKLNGGANVCGESYTITLPPTATNLKLIDELSPIAIFPKFMFVEGKSARLPMGAVALAVIEG